KLVGVAGIGAASHVLLDFILRKNGVDPKEVKVIAVGLSTFPPALEGGKIVAGMAGEPFFSRMVAKGTAFSLGNLSSLKETQAILGGEYVFSGAITRPDVIQKRPQIVQKVVTALVKASHFIETKTPEEIASAVPAELVSERGQYIEALRASREIYAPQGMVSPTGVDTLMKSLDSFGVFKEGQKVDVATTYDITDPPIARLASMNASTVSTVIASIRMSPKYGRRWCVVNEAWFSIVVRATAWIFGWRSSASCATSRNVGTVRAGAAGPRTLRSPSSSRAWILTAAASANCLALRPLPIFFALRWP